MAAPANRPNRARFAGDPPAPEFAEPIYDDSGDFEQLLGEIKQWLNNNQPANSTLVEAPICVQTLSKFVEAAEFITGSQKKNGR